MVVDELVEAPMDVEEVLLTVRGGRYYLWRAIDQDGNSLAILASGTRQWQRESFASS
jgi:transposase-like protein